VFEVINFFPFQFHVGVDHVVGEDVTFLQVVTIGVQGFQGFAQGTANCRHVSQFFWWQVVQVLVHGIAWVDFVGNPVKASHQHGGERQVGIGHGVREADFDALALGVGGERGGYKYLGNIMLQ